MIAGVAIACAPFPAFAAADANADAGTGARASYERVGEVIVNAMICQPFGYSVVEREGLALWTERQVSALAEQTEGYDREDAVRRVNRAATSNYWFVRNRYEGAFALVNLTAYYNPQRFRSRYRDKCAELANSSDVGAFFSKTHEEPDTLELLAQVRNVMYSDAVVEQFERAYPPYLGR